MSVLGVTVGVKEKQTDVDKKAESNTKLRSVTAAVNISKPETL
jgi:hypothetical protein